MINGDDVRRIRDQAKIVFKSRFLKNLSKVERYEFLQLCHRREYAQDETIYYQDDPGAGMYFIEQGTLQLITHTPSQEHAFTHTLKAPDSFGALSIGYQFRRFATAKCLTDCTLLGFFKPDFETLKKRQPNIAVKFIETLAMLSMQQLSVAMNRLKKQEHSADGTPLQFDAYYEKHDHTDQNGIF